MNALGWFLIFACVVGPALLLLVLSLDHHDAHAGDLPYDRACRATFGARIPTVDLDRPAGVQPRTDHARPESRPTPPTERDSGPASTHWTTAQLHRAANTTHHQ